MLRYKLSHCLRVLETHLVSFALRPCCICPLPPTSLIWSWGAGALHCTITRKEKLPETPTINCGGSVPRSVRLSQLHETDRESAKVNRAGRDVVIWARVGWPEVHAYRRWLCTWAQQPWQAPTQARTVGTRKCIRLFFPSCSVLFFFTFSSFDVRVKGCVHARSRCGRTPTSPVLMEGMSRQDV
jgi:hypothetical protein